MNIFPQPVCLFILICQHVCDFVSKHGNISVYQFVYFSVCQSIDPSVLLVDQSVYQLLVDLLLNFISAKCCPSVQTSASVTAAATNNLYHFSAGSNLPHSRTHYNTHFPFQGILSMKLHLKKYVCVVA